MMVREESTLDPDLERQYRQARSGSLVADRSDLGRLAIAGNDALDLLHRLTTQDLKALPPWEGRVAAFVTAKGRILDRVILMRLDDRLLGITDADRASKVKDWIDRYTFREEVRVEDWSASHGTFGIYGKEAAGLLAALFGDAAVRHPIHQPRSVAWEGSEAVLARTDPLAGEGFLLTAGRAVLTRLGSELLRPERGAIAAGPACLEVLRIEAGRPAAGRELTEEFNPWEAGMRDAIALNKGCYVGQEVIARLNTYQKVSKFLARVAWEGAGVPGGRAALEIEGRPAGTLTSAARVPGSPRVVGLGYVAEEAALPGRPIEITWERERARGVIEGVAR